MLTRIKGEGLKARDFDIDLTGRDAMVGQARSGKSTVRQALVWLATGQNPDVGLSLKDAGLLMRDRQMTVRCEWDDGAWAERTLTRHGQSLRQTGMASWLPPDTGTTEVLEAIRARFGADDRQARENLDIAGLLGLTGPQQAEAINALLEESGMSEVEIAVRLGAMTAVRMTQGGEVELPTETEALATVRAGAEAQMGQTHRERFTALVGEAQARTSHDGMTAAIAWAKGQKRDAQAALQSKIAARKEVEDRDAGLEAPAATLEQLNAERQTLTDEIAGLRSELSRHEQGTKARAEAAQALEKAEIALDAVTQDGDPEQVAAEMRTRADALDDEAAKIADPSPPVAPGGATADDAVVGQVERLDDQAEELQLRSREIEDEVEAPTYDPLPDLPSTEAAKVRLALAEQKLKAGQRDPWTEVLHIGEDLVLGAEEAAPTRGKRLVELADEHGADIGALKDAVETERGHLRRLETSREEIQEARERIEQLNATRKAEYDATLRQARGLREEAERLRAEAATLRGQEANRVAQANAERDRAYRAARAEWRVTADTTARKRTGLQQQAKKLRADADALVHTYGEVKHQVERADARIAGMAEVDPIDTDQHELRIAEANQAIARIDETKRAVEGADARRRELDALAQEIHKAEATRDVAAALAWALPKLRDEDLAARRGPILDRMSRFLEAAGLSDRPYLEAKKGAVDYGLIIGTGHPDLEVGHRVHGQVLSGAESILFRASLWSAIVGLRAPDTPVLALEIDDLDDAMAGRFFAGIEALDIPNVLVCTNRPLPIPASFTRHEMAHAEAAA